MHRILLTIFYRSLFTSNKLFPGGRDSAVGITTGCVLDGPGIEFRWQRDFPPPSRPARKSSNPPVQWLPQLSRGVMRMERGADHPTHSNVEDASEFRLFLCLPSVPAIIIYIYIYIWCVITLKYKIYNV